jgi:hypothetical protein
MKKIFFSIIMAVLVLFSGVAFAGNNAHEFTAVSILPNAVRATTATGLDILNDSYIGIGKLILTAVAGGSGITSTVKMQDSADNSTWADISGCAFAAVGNAVSLQSIPINLEKAKKYIRAVDTVAGGSCTGATAVILLAKPKYQ